MDLFSQNESEGRQRAVSHSTTPLLRSDLPAGAPRAPDQARAHRIEGGHGEQGSKYKPDQIALDAVPNTVVDRVHEARTDIVHRSVIAYVAHRPSPIR